MAETPLAGRTVLVVEDEILVALDIADTLTAAGARVCGPCVSLKQALDAAGSAAMDCAVLDIDLGGQEVFPAARVLQARGIPFVFYTGQPEREALRDEFAGVAVCVKPLRPERLVDALAALDAPKPLQRSSSSR